MSETKIKCIVIDDEPLARTCIIDYVNQVDYVELVGVGNNPVELTNLLEKQEADLIFLDIQMPKMNGIEYLKMTSQSPMVIITTAYPSYALEGFELAVLDYLVKPITFDRFLKAIGKAKDYYHLIHQSNPIEKESKKENAYFFVKCDLKYERIYFDQIIYVEAVQNYVAFHTEKGKLLTLMTLKNVEANLNPDSFIRIHKSYIVAKEKIESIDGNQIILGEARIPLSRNYRKEVMERLMGNKIWKNNS